MEKLRTTPNYNIVLLFDASVDVTASSGDGSGLDNLRTKPFCLGKSVVSSQLSVRGEENALLEMEQEIFKDIERLKSEGVPVDDILKEVLSASAELHAYLEQSHPRAP
jgi:hypothetical protein